MEKKDSNKNTSQEHNIILREKVCFLTNNSYKILKLLFNDDITNKEEVVKITEKDEKNEIKKSEIIECLLLSFLLFDSSNVKSTLINEINSLDINDYKKEKNNFNHFLHIIYRIAKLINTMPILTEKKEIYRNQLREYLKLASKGEENINISGFVNIESEQMEDAKLLIKHRTNTTK